MTASTIGQPFLRRLHLHLPRLRLRIGGVEREFPVPTRPLWQTVALLYGALALLTAAVIALAFLIAFVVTGRPY
ncbi:MAG TPA: hypothetical protein VGJ25_05780 [Gaiellaceae bacterium]|jgi:hypothetical protein